MQLVCALFALIAVAIAQDVEDGVYVGTDDNLQKIIDTTEFVLAEFYAPWCGHCKNLAPEYAKAANALKDLNNVKLVKVDATVHSAAASPYDIQGYPTIKFLKSGKPVEYTGGRTAAEIESWVRKESGPASTLVATVDAANALFKARKVVVFGAFESSKNAEYKVFLNAASLSNVVYAHTFDAEVAKELKAAVPSVTVHKTFDGGDVAYTGGYVAEDIAEFVAANTLPLLIEFSEENADQVFGGNVKKHLLFFANSDAAGTDAITNTLTNVAATVKGKMLFVWVDSAVEAHSRILEYFHLSTDNLPAIRVIDLEKEMAKYVFDQEITEENLSAFINNFLEGKVERHLNSAEIPENWDAEGVKVLVGKNFKSVVNNNDVHVFVEFYAPWCGHCKQLAPVWDELGEHYKENKNVIIAKIDGTVNELEEVSIQSFPTLKFFKKNDKANPLEYDGERDLESLINYVEAQIAETGHDEF